MLKENQISKTHFSSCFDNERFDERQYIQAVIEKTGAKGNQVFPDPKELLKIFDQITWHQDEPIWSASLFAQWKVFELAKQCDVTVILDGQGADEILAGYMGLFRQTQSHNTAGSFLKKVVGGQLRAAASQVKSKFKTASGTAFGQRSQIWNDSYRFLKENQFIPAHCQDVRDLSIQLVQNFHMPSLLHYEDRNSMAHSREGRVPFLDHRLVELALQLPDGFKMGELNKIILRESMDGVIPDIVKNRRDKMGFVTPQELWMFEDHPEDFRKLIDESLPQELFNHSFFLELFDNMKAKNIPRDNVIWRALAVSRWIKTFEVQLS